MFLLVLTLGMLSKFCFAQQNASTLKQTELILQSIQWGKVNIELPDSGVLSSNKIKLDVNVYENNGFANMQNLNVQKNMYWEWSDIEFTEGLSNISVVIKILLEINGESVWATLYKEDLVVNNSTNYQSLIMASLLVLLLLGVGFYYKKRLNFIIKDKSKK